MVSLDDVKDLVLYKRPFYLPIDPKDKKHNSLIMLLTPNYKSSMNMMQSPYTINRRYFESYYIEKSVFRYIKNESVYEPNDDGEYLFEHSPIYDISTINPESISEEDIKEDARAFDIKYRDDVLDKIPNELDFEDPIREASVPSVITTSVIIRNDKGQLLTIEDSNGYLSVPSVRVDSENDKWQALSDYLKSEYKIDPLKYAFLYDFNFTYEDKFKNTILDYDYLYMIKEYSGKVSKGVFMTPGEILANRKEKSKILNYFIARYGTKLINRNSMSYIEKKMGTGQKTNIVFSGFFFRYNDCVSNASRDSSVITAESNAKNTLSSFIFNVFPSCFISTLSGMFVPSILKVSPFFIINSIFSKSISKFVISVYS